MNTWITSLSYGLILIIVVSAPAIILISILKIIAERNKRKSISPLSSGMLRDPGYSLRLRFDSLWMDISAYFMLLPSFALIPLAVTGLNALRGKPTNTWMVSIPCVVAIIYIIKKMISLLLIGRNIRLGMEAEIVCGQELSQLMHQGWRVFHDFPANKGKTKFNIDHVLIGPTGVYAVETKGRRKPLTKSGQKQYEAVYRDGYIQFPHGRDVKTIEQAKAGAKYLSGWLSKACGFEVKVTPALIFPGWFFKQDLKPPFPLGNPKGVISYIKNNLNIVFTEQQCTQMAHQIEQAVRIPDYMDGS